MSNVLLTGGCGFVGSNATDYLLKKGHNVLAVDNFFRKDVLKNLQWLVSNHGKNKKFNFVKADVTKDINLLNFLCKEHDIDFILHTAAQTTMVTSITNPREDFEINAIGTFNMCEVAKENNCSILHLATNKVYGSGTNSIKMKANDKRWIFDDPKFKNGIPESFESDWNEHSPYGCSKYTGDLYVRDFGCTYGLNTGSFRCSCLYGVNQFGVVEQGWVLHFIISAVKKRKVTIFGDGKQVRDTLYIEDLVKLFEKVIENPKKLKNEPFNVGGGIEHSMSILELIDYLEDFGFPVKHDFDDWRLADQKIYISDISKVSSRFNWSPKIGPKEGVKKSLGWVIINKDLF
jgi:CDP-paratose 2-epimerase